MWRGSSGVFSIFGQSLSHVDFIICIYIYNPCEEKNLLGFQDEREHIVGHKAGDGCSCQRLVAWCQLKSKPQNISPL